VLIAFNPGAGPRHFSAQELTLAESDSGPEWNPRGAAATRDFLLKPGQSVPVSLDFDVPPKAGALRLEWRRSAERMTLLATRPPPRVAQDAPPRWPRRVEELPLGNPSSGAELFQGRFACVACHGDPTRAGSPRIGPSLHDFARVGASRMEGRSAAQYAYESLLDPSAFIAPGCAGQDVCAQPSTMPMYGDSLSPQQMADLLSYLLQVRE
jgi:mono/diheme cytochrome c family protein